jgi:protein ImuB
MAPEARVDEAIVPRIAPMGGTRQALSPLPIAALRVDADTVAGLARLGLRRIDDLWGMPRANLSRRFGQGLVLRLDQALGLQPEPISPAGAPLHFAVRLSLPEPIGLEGDILDGLDRLLPPLCAKLRAKGRGARQLRLEMFKAEGGVERIDLGLARPTDQPDDVRPLFALKLKGVDAGFGFDTLRLLAPMTEPLHKLQHKGGWAVAQDNKSRAAAQAAGDTGTALDDLITRIGTRVGLDNITRHRPADSHVPEKTSTRLAAAWSDAETDWPETARPRPLTLFAPEPVTAPTVPEVPAEFRWRGRRFETRSATGPERIAPEWWLDDPNWRSGVRDYWRITTLDGHLFWLFFAHGGTLSGGWFCQGDFC